MNLRTGNSEFYGVFDEIDVLLRSPVLFFGVILFITCKENVVPVFCRLPCSKRLTVSFTRLNANLGRVSRPDEIRESWTRKLRRETRLLPDPHQGAAVRKVDRAIHLSYNRPQKSFSCMMSFSSKTNFPSLM